MAVRNLWLLGGGLAACLVLCGDGYTQQPPPPGPVLPPVPPPVVSDPTPPHPLVPVAPTPPPEPTVDQLLDRLTELRRQKAELEKQEQLVVKQLRDKLKAQTERLEKLGIAPGPKAESGGRADASDFPVIPPVTTRN